MRVFVGIVGYCGFVRGYPLGPELMQRLGALPWPAGSEVAELNWGPLAIVQDFQARAQRPDRVVLIGAPDRGLPAGAVRCRRWVGGAVDALAVQRRMFEAVTGVISLDNLLVIGSHFGIWPAQTCSVELQWPASGLGDLVLREAACGGDAVVGQASLDGAGAAAVERLLAVARALALDDEAWPKLPALTAAMLAPTAAVLHPLFHEELDAP